MDSSKTGSPLHQMIYPKYARVNQSHVSDTSVPPVIFFQ